VEPTIGEALRKLTLDRIVPNAGRIPFGELAPGCSPDRVSEGRTLQLGLCMIVCWSSYMTEVNGPAWLFLVDQTNPQ